MSISVITNVSPLSSLLLSPLRMIRMILIMDTSDIIRTTNAPTTRMEHSVYCHADSDISGKIALPPFCTLCGGSEISALDGRKTVLRIVMTQAGRMHERADVPRRTMRFKR